MSTDNSDHVPGRGSPQHPEPEGAVWSYRGYELRPSDFTTAMVHLFRAEINRANVWRTRLDSTTNWAIVATAAAVPFAFNESGGSHIVLILSSVLVSILLYIEARRYRYYELWSSRVRLMETDFFATMLVPPFHPGSDWGEALAENLLQPRFGVSIFEALGRRLRRNYIWIYSVLLMAWLGKLWLQPEATSNWSVFLNRASLGTIGGGVTLTVYLGFYLFLIVFAVVTARLQQATGEVLPSLGEMVGSVSMERSPFDPKSKEPKGRAWFRSSRRRSQYLVLIITDQAQPVADQIMAAMHRGVTALQGQGMYSGKAHQVLMSAVTVTEVEQLKSLVRQVDPAAFVVVTPAQEVLGRGFVTP
jgi:uncharacterized membrane protein